MKKSLLTLFVCAVTTTMALGQGQINFDNRESVLGRSALVINEVTGTGLVGQDYRAQLFLASSPLTAAVTQAPSSFRIVTTGFPGTWANGIRDFIPSLTVGSTVDLIVKVWQGSLYATYEDALSSGNVASLAGQSDPFAYTIPPAGSPPPLLVMGNFQGFNVSPIPEPSTIALGIIGCAALLFRFRKK